VDPGQPARRPGRVARLPVSELRDQVVEIVRERGYRRLDAPVRLASGEMSLDYINGKRALADGEHLKVACEALLELVRSAGVDFDAVGGLTLGADQFAHVLAVLSRRSWFVVRKNVKDHGTRQRIEGAELRPGVDVLLVDDVVSTGGSILEALEAVRETGARVVMAVTLVDRGEVAGEHFARRGIPYRAVVTYRDLGIEPVGRREGVPEPSG
jgi:orotate phosphoribosyltransferase